MYRALGFARSRFTLHRASAITLPSLQGHANWYRGFEVTFSTQSRKVAKEVAHNVAATSPNEEQSKLDVQELSSTRPRAGTREYQRQYYQKNKETILAKIRLARVWKGIEKKAQKEQFGIHHILNFFQDRKVNKLEVYDVAAKSNITDFLVMVTCPSAKNMNALAHRLMKEARTGGACPRAPSVINVSGGREIDDWVILDIGRLCWVHFFSEKGEVERTDLENHHQDDRVPFEQWHLIKNPWERKHPVAPAMADDPADLKDSEEMSVNLDFGKMDEFGIFDDRERFSDFEAQFDSLDERFSKLDLDIQGSDEANKYLGFGSQNSADLTDDFNVDYLDGDETDAEYDVRGKYEFSDFDEDTLSDDDEFTDSDIDSLDEDEADEEYFDRFTDHVHTREK